ncbi:MAG: acetyl-CoA hydrolase/transferase C-terminal domain-containing protein [Clostridiales bacterium]|nr:acetyl-CoA hydrolase/transferase C-terminal domain-containing protein [Clostridiales bacterium]MDO5140320.1 acetyl-CoA hydrolase/transferase C-terminal domain-containing protein [Eubacteriales bacterium]
MDFYSEYRSKLRTPDEAVKVIKSGDWVDYSAALAKPVLLDEALSRRRDELTDVKIRGNLMDGPVHVAECDPSQEHFIYHTWHCSAYERSLCDKGMCYYTPMVFHNLAAYYTFFITVDVAMVSVTPMDKHGYFGFSIHTGTTGEILRRAKTVILEINEQLPKVRGGYDDCIHISDVDYIVEGEHKPFAKKPAHEISENERRIAENILPYVKDGATIQIGIGGMPDAVGSLLARSDLKDLGMHTELCSDAYLELYHSGKLTNRLKNLNKEKQVLGFAIGSPELYDWLDDNPSVLTFPLEYVNNPSVIGKIDNMVSINSCITVDLFGQVCAESVGTRQISGTGGQLDFLEGASISRGGKSFICLNSTYTDAEGNIHSCILPHFQGDIVTSPRSQVYYIATEYGVVNLEGASSWERAERLISIAHPTFRDRLIREAEKMKIWRKT